MKRRPFNPIQVYERQKEKYKNGKQCVDCKETKPTTEFYTRGTGHFQQRCKPCDVEYSVRNQLKNRFRRRGIDALQELINQTEKDLARYYDILEILKKEKES